MKIEYSRGVFRAAVSAKMKGWEFLLDLNICLLCCLVKKPRILLEGMIVVSSQSALEGSKMPLLFCLLNICGYDYWHPVWGLWGNGHLPVPVPSRSGVWQSIAAIKAVCDVDSLWLVQVSKHHCATLWPDMGHNITESQGSLFVARCHYLSCWHSEHVEGNTWDYSLVGPNIKTH